MYFIQHRIMSIRSTQKRVRDGRVFCEEVVDYVLHPTQGWRKCSRKYLRWPVKSRMMGATKRYLGGIEFLEARRV